MGRMEASISNCYKDSKRSQSKAFMYTAFVLLENDRIT